MQNSIVNIPVSINLDDVEKIINQQVKGFLYEDRDLTDRENDQLMLVVRKDADIRLSLKEQQILYTVPLAIWLKKGTFIGPVVAEGNLFLYFSTRFQVLEDWSLETETRIVNHEWRRKPRAKLGAVRVPFKMIANRILKRAKGTVAGAIDQQISKKLELRKYIEEAWSKMQDPLLLSATYKMWMKINPLSLSMTPLKTSRQILKSTISVESDTEVMLGDKPAVDRPLPLPPFRQVFYSDEDFVIHIDVDIPFEEAEKIARDFVAGESFSNGKQEIRVENIQLSGEEDKLVVNTTVSGAYTGSIYFSGKPVYNKESGAVEMDEMNFELGTGNLLLKSISWLFKKGLIRKIRESMRFPLGDKIRDIRKLLADKLQDYELSPNILLRGTIEQLDVGEPVLKAGSLGVRVMSHGSLSILVKGLEI